MSSYGIRLLPWLLFLYLAVIATLLFHGELKMPGAMERDTRVGKEEQVLLAYYDPGWNEETRGLPSLRVHYRGLDLISPNWYGINTNGELVLPRGAVEVEVKQLAAAGGIRVLPLVTNYRGNHQVLMYETSRKRAAQNIIDLVIENDYDGVNIDFELIPPEYASQLAELLKEVYGSLKPMNKTVAVSVFPKVDFPRKYHGVHDYKDLVNYADYICLMAYDRHSPRTGPGPIAPLSWVEENIRYALEIIPPEKLIISVGAYGYDWSLAGTGVEALGIDQAMIRAGRYQAEILWNETSKTPYYRYKKNDVYHEVWYENSQSVSSKVSLVTKYDLAGLAFWRLGYENNAYLNELKKIL